MASTTEMILAVIQELLSANDTLNRFPSVPSEHSTLQQNQIYSQPVIYDAPMYPQFFTQQPYSSSLIPPSERGPRSYRDLKYLGNNRDHPHSTQSAHSGWVPIFNIAQQQSMLDMYRDLMIPAGRAMETISTALNHYTASLQHTASTSRISQISRTLSSSNEGIFFLHRRLKLF